MPFAGGAVGWPAVHFCSEPDRVVGLKKKIDQPRVIHVPNIATILGVVTRGDWNACLGGSTVCF